MVRRVRRCWVPAAPVRVKAPRGRTISMCPIPASAATWALTKTTRTSPPRRPARAAMQHPLGIRRHELRRRWRPDRDPGQAGSAQGTSGQCRSAWMHDGCRRSRELRTADRHFSAPEGKAYALFNWINHQRRRQQGRSQPAYVQSLLDTSIAALTCDGEPALNMVAVSTFWDSYADYHRPPADGKILGR